MKKFVLFSMLALTGCFPSGPMYSAATKSGSTEVIVYHPHEFVGSLPINSPDVKVNGKTECALPTGGYFLARISPGATEISSTKALAFGTSRLSFKAASNHRYFVRMTWNDSKVLSTAGAGLVGEGIAEGVSSHSGPFILDLVDKQQAESELQSLHMADCN